MIYSVDSSAWLDGWVRDYPKDVFPSLWEKLAACASDGIFKTSEEVAVEMQKKDDGLYKWLKSIPSLIVPIDEDIQRIVSDLLVKYPRLVDTQRNRSQGDPFVIATAEALNAVVVTGEKSGKPDSPKIPDVCNARKIRPISFLEMLRELEWKF